MTDRSISKPSAEAVFGSQARGDSDIISDRDYLIVDDCPKILKNRSVELKQEGWSVASYTFRKLQALSDSGALFVQHLKDESGILRDEEGRFQKLLTDFQPKTCYLEDIHANAKLAKLIETRPFGARGIFWCTDLLYVALRNYGVLRLAQDGIYKFSFRDVIQSLADIGDIKSCTTTDFMNLRFAKSVYRSGDCVNSKKTESLISKLLPALPSDYFPNFSRSLPSSTILNEIARQSDFASHYHRLRTIEKGLISTQSMNIEILDSKTKTKLERWIRDPRCYAFQTLDFDFSIFEHQPSKNRQAIYLASSVGK